MRRLYKRGEKGVARSWSRASLWRARSCRKPCSPRGEAVKYSPRSFAVSTSTGRCVYCLDRGGKLAREIMGVSGSLPSRSYWKNVKPTDTVRARNGTIGERGAPELGLARVQTLLLFNAVRAPTYYLLRISRLHKNTVCEGRYVGEGRYKNTVWARENVPPSQNMRTSSRSQLRQEEGALRHPRLKRAGGAIRFLRFHPVFPGSVQENIVPIHLGRRIPI